MREKIWLMKKRYVEISKLMLELTEERKQLGEMIRKAEAKDHCEVVKEESA